MKIDKDTHVLFYVEPYLGRSAGFKEKSALLADWYCHSEAQLIHEAVGMAMGASLKYRRFRIAAYNADNGGTLHTFNHVN